MITSLANNVIILFRRLRRMYLSPKNFDITHEKILASAKTHFMEYGYDRTNLRDLCKNAEITTGAFYRHFDDKQALFTELVKPALEIFPYLMQDGVNRSDIANKKGDMQSIWNTSEDVYKNYMILFYDNFDAFKLILCYANGSKHENFFDEFIDAITDETLAFTKSIYEEKGISNLPDKDELHILLTALWRCILEPIMHDFSREKALSFCATINRIFNFKMMFEF